jgi:hypothetical protein
VIVPAARRSASHASCAESPAERCRNSRWTAAPASGLGSATRAFPTCTIRRSATRCPPPRRAPHRRRGRLRVHHALRARPRTDRRTSPAAGRAAREPDGALPLQQLPGEHHLRRGQIRHPLPGPSRTRRARQLIKACLNGGTARQQYWRCYADLLGVSGDSAGQAARPGLKQRGQVARAGYTSGPLFRASINGRGGPLSYDTAHHRWKKFIPGEHEGTLSGST